MVKKLWYKVTTNRLIAEFFSKETRDQLIRYIIVGFLSVGLDFILVFGLTEFAKLWYILSKSIAYIIGFWFNFLLNRYWSFNARQNFVRQIKLYAILFVFNFCITNSLMFLLTDKFKIYYLISNIFVIGIMTIWNFFLYKKVIYK